MFILQGSASCATINLSMKVYQLVQPTTFFGQTYGCDAYGQNAYNTCSTTQSAGGSSSSSSRLADTGLTVGIFVAVAIVVLAAALVVRFWHRKRQAKKQSSKTD